MPTALELTREEWQPYIKAAQKRPARSHLAATGRQEHERLLDRARELAVALKEQFGVRRVILFGSLVDPDWFSPGSDVDLAVEGLATADFWNAWQLAEEMIADRPVDLIEIETAKESLRQAIQRYGLEL
jgi:predicted nucleotidyltransferase